MDLKIPASTKLETFHQASGAGILVLSKEDHWSMQRVSKGNVENRWRPLLHALVAVLSLQFSDKVMSQVLDFKTFPYVEVVLPHEIPSSSDGMGLLEFAVDDLVRNSFANPAKSYLLDHDYMLISGNLASYQIESKNVTSGAGGSETLRNEKATTSILPVSGVFRLGSIRLGALASYLKSTSYADNRQTGGGPPATYSLDLKSSGYPFMVIVGLALGENIGIGMAHGRSDVSTSGSLSFLNQSRDREQSAVEKNYRFGVVYNDEGQARVSVVGVRYDWSDNLTDTQTGNPPSSHKEQVDGWAVQGEYRRTIEAIGEISLRATLDMKQLKERSTTGSTIDSESESEATLLQIGLGAARKEGDLTIAGEIMLEPGWMSGESPPDGSSLRSQWKFNNWRLRFGLGTSIMERLDWKVGMEYLKFGSASQQFNNATSTNTENDPYASAGRTVLTTGIELRFGQVRVLYNFLYASSTYTGLLVAASNNFNFLAPYEVTPITHRLNVSYELD